jgi:hypothetical protein
MMRRTKMTNVDRAKNIAWDLFKKDEFQKELILYICDDIERFTSVAKICILLSRYNVPYELHVEVLAHLKTHFYDTYVVPERVRYSVGSQWISLDDIKEGLKYFPVSFQHEKTNRIFNSNTLLEVNNG